MGKKSYVGIDIGYESLKLALVNNGRVEKVYSYPMPERLIRQGQPTSAETLVEVLCAALKDSGVREKKAALVISDENAFVKNVVMPKMTVSQLAMNLPYEFRDYITEGIKDYIFDYAMEEDVDADSGEMKLLASAVRAEYLQTMRGILKKAGLSMQVALPTICAYISCIRTQQEQAKEYCFLDLGYKNIRMYIFEGDRFRSIRELDTGMSLLDDLISEKMDVERHAAHNLLLMNKDEIQTSEACMETYSRIAIDIMRALNFYKFSNQESELDAIYVLGGGSGIEALQEVLRNHLDIEVRGIEELVAVPAGTELPGTYAQAIGAAMSEGGQ